MESLNTLGKKFYHALKSIDIAQEKDARKREKAEKIHVVGAGGTITAAYEQLRNAAENAEEHLLLQKAIRRFYKRAFLTQQEKDIETSADELVTELTFAGYIANDSVPEYLLRSLNKLAKQYYAVYLYIQSDNKLSNLSVDAWVFDVLAVNVGVLFRDRLLQEGCAQFAFEYFKSALDDKEIFDEKPSDYDTSLFVAIHRELLKSDPVLIRSALLKSYAISPDNMEQFCQTNQNIDTVMTSKNADVLARVVSRQGAPLRVLFRMIESQEDFSKLLLHQKRFLGAFESQIENEYKSISQRINRGVVKSIIFLIITKVLIGIAVEIPYDYLLHGTIIWLPLAVNLLFPPVYMALLRSTLTLPPNANTIRLVRQAQNILFEDKKETKLYRRKKQFGNTYNILYVLFIMAVFAGVSWLLVTYAKFEWIHLVIFFVFLSGASFLGFRLSRMIREVESIDSEQNGATIVRDFLYMPFVVVGQKISETYAQLNLVAMVLDMVIELPLKTVLRLIRQWSHFISAKKDQL
ncbi:hypothetical protein EOL73_04670 [Candidatus Saccharibacteria bacterium]|nr:hypothetical protein [Candidatus Saccharibacteria bacterium]